jgi:thimet oligopeptidase
MEHRQVETFLHEFGHMLHLIFSGKRDWALQNGFIGLEPDFGEAPSTMLENWVWDYDTLKRFATNDKGEVIPEALVARMNRARGFAEAYNDTRQLGLSAVSLGLYTGAPPTDLTRAYIDTYNRYDISPLRGVDVHPHANFGHLTGYGAAYYTYLWSKAISSDLFTRFEANGLRDPATARRYRELVLAPGSSKPAETLVRDFLNRPLSLDAYRERLTR